MSRIEIKLDAADAKDLDEVRFGIRAHTLTELFRRIIRWLAQHPELWSQIP